MIYIAGTITFVVCLFILFSLSRNDFVLIRKNISPVIIFDAVFTGFFLAFIVGRIFFILDSGEYVLLYPLSFFHFLKYPGISVLGVVLGVFFSLFAFRKKKVFLRLSDIFGLSFFPVFLISLLLRFTNPAFFIVKIVVVVGALIFFWLLIQYHKKYTMHDGSILLGVLLLLALDTFISQLQTPRQIFFMLFSFSQWVSIGIGLCSLIFLIWNEKFIKRR